MIFEFSNTVDGDEDCVYVRAETRTKAHEVFNSYTGEVPNYLLKVRAVKSVPEGEVIWE